jgi:hypothetical protein
MRNMQVLSFCDSTNEISLLRICFPLIGTKDPQNHPYFRDFLTEDANKPPLPLTRIFPEAANDPSDEGADFFESSPLKGQKVKLEDFELIRVIGKGSFGKVLFVTNSYSYVIYVNKHIIELTDRLHWYGRSRTIRCML